MSDKNNNKKTSKPTKDIADNSVEKNNNLSEEKILDNGKSEFESDTEIELNNKLSEARNNAKENFEKMLRSKAELENYKKRTSRDMDELRKYATESIMRELLNVVDNLERAISSSKDDKKNVDSIIEGVNLTLNEILKILEKYHVTSIESVGKPFDPKIHEAMSQEEEIKYPPNTVIKEFLKGYLIHDRLLRPSMVVVSKKSKKTKT